MKYLGIGMLFLLSVGAGFWKAAKLELRIRTLRDMRKDLRMLLSEIRTRKTSLKTIAQKMPDGAIRAALQEETGSMRLRTLSEAERERLTEFLTLLMDGNMTEIESAAHVYLSELDTALENGQQLSGQAKLYRAIGAVCGTALAVLLW
ncbi:MAG: stage III sporulation protein AB [Clostridia bacterium]|nr:stage III sporulation protein AB [Clostridia bacterium]